MLHSAVIVPRRVDRGLHALEPERGTAAYMAPPRPQAYNGKIIAYPCDLTFGRRPALQTLSELKST